MEVRKIPLEQIDQDDHFFLITYPLNPKPLTSSIRRVGLLQPVLLRKLPSQKYQIVSGFKRVLACRDLDFETIDAFVYDLESLEDLEGFRWNLWDTLAVRTLNLAEKAIVLDKLLHRFGLEERGIVRDYMPILGLEPSLKVLEGYLQVHQLEEEVKDYLVAKEIPLKLALELLRFSPEDRKQILSLVRPLELNVHTLKEFLTLIEEVIGRDGIRVENLLDDSGIRDILANLMLSISQKTEKIRKILKRIRYPRLTGLEDQIQEKLQQLRLPKAISIAPPPFLEGDQLKVTFQFRDKKDLENVLGKLHELADKEELDAILMWIAGP